MKRIRFFLFIASLLPGGFIMGQPYFQLHDSIQVKVNGSYLANPWAGGLNFIQASTIDLNMDGIKDLFIFDRSGNKIRTFINNGTANMVSYKYDPSYESKFPDLHDWALLADYNCDGKEDIFSYTNGGIRIFKNISDNTNGLQFVLVNALQYSEYNPGQSYNLYVSSVDVPAITDIDNDGDLDILTFSIIGSYIEYHQNQSIDLFGTCDSLKFVVKNNCWGFASENAFNFNYTLHDSCFGNVPNPQLAPYSDPTRAAERHQGSCLLCLDIDGDTDKDLITGDISFNNLTLLTNGGSPTQSNIIATDGAFPSQDTNTAAVDLTIFPCGYYLDVNNDGAKDLIASPNAPNASENHNSVVYYKNVGSTASPVFQYQQSNLLQDNMIELGEGAYPVFFDYDNDGLKDLFIGDYGYFATGGFKHKIAQFKNIGTATVPKFELITLDYAGMSTLGITNMIPAFGDMDGDNDADMIVGGYDGKLHYFQNIATAGDSANFVLSQPNFKNSNNRVIDVGDFAVPQIVDLDNDGKKDLIIGSRNGKVAYYHHIGSATSTIPSMDSVTHFFGNVKVNLQGSVTGYSYPFVFKENGVTKLMVGKESGYLSLYDNIDGNLNGAFTLVDSMFGNIFQGTRTAPNGADITNDGYMDLIVGNYEGGVSFYKGISNPTTVHTTADLILWDLQLFPNPADNSFTVKVISDNNVGYQLDLYDMLGQKIISRKVENNRLIVNTENIAKGIYVCKVTEINTSNLAKAKTRLKRIVITH